MVHFVPEIEYRSMVTADFNGLGVGTCYPNREALIKHLLIFVAAFKDGNSAVV